MANDIQATLVALEAERGQALIDEDYGRLAELNTDDLVHIHATGKVETKGEYLDNVKAQLRFRKVERPELSIRSYGDIAVMTGLLKQTVFVKANDLTIEMEAAVTQVWRCEGGAWRICSFQATHVA